MIPNQTILKEAPQLSLNQGFLWGVLLVFYQLCDQINSQCASSLNDGGTKNWSSNQVRLSKSAQNYYYRQRRMGCVQPNEKKESFQHQMTIKNRSILNNPYLPEKETVRVLQPKIDKEVNQKKIQKQVMKRKPSLAKLFQQHRKKHQNQKQTFLLKYISTQTENTKETITLNKQATLKTNLEEHLKAVKKMIEQQGEDITTCGICMQEYDLVDREPMMLCMNQHTFCIKCLKDLTKRGFNRCPLDQQVFDLKEVKKNRIVCELLAKIKSNAE